ncbi:hypothetical protein Misp01_80580 [Microtetraspora sp. NBRC 13810]|uniref:formate dehydrogenase subunit delta n=1 Tax=Microtetraspora sp. NBRC 13810 TaxID=3030990 RepID=UPI0024A38760|nr:formate dehydrogenase subunit delta [Microtetraspora sp. NBRC 13810]GLW12930.1 hypothetical protein Misp01_80580 [Microtetraspora sp. NBRC 13810]
MAQTHEPPHIRLANEIAVQFRHRDPDIAAKEIAVHIQAFWDPRMRTKLVIDAADPASGLDPVAVAAAALLTPPR